MRWVFWKRTRTTRSWKCWERDLDAWRAAWEWLRTFEKILLTRRRVLTQRDSSSRHHLLHSRMNSQQEFLATLMLNEKTTRKSWVQEIMIVLITENFICYFETCLNLTHIRTGIGCSQVFLQHICFDFRIIMQRRSWTTAAGWKWLSSLIIRKNWTRNDTTSGKRRVIEDTGQRLRSLSGRNPYNPIEKCKRTVHRSGNRGRQEEHQKAFE